MIFLSSMEWIRWRGIFPTSPHICSLAAFRSYNTPPLYSSTMYFLSFSGTASYRLLLSSHFLLNKRSAYLYAPSQRMVTIVFPGPSLTAKSRAAATFKALDAPRYRPSSCRHLYTISMLDASGMCRAPSKRSMSGLRLSVTRP